LTDLHEVTSTKLHGTPVAAAMIHTGGQTEDKQMDTWKITGAFREYSKSHKKKNIM
jgi:hypothetical protein